MIAGQVLSDKGGRSAAAAGKSPKRQRGLHNTVRSNLQGLFYAHSSDVKFLEHAERVRILGHELVFGEAKRSFHIPTLVC